MMYVCFQIDDMSRCLLIASGPCRTLKYLQALACGVPCVSYTFVVDSIKQVMFFSVLVKMKRKDEDRALLKSQLSFCCLLVGSSS